MRKIYSCLVFFFSCYSFAANAQKTSFTVYPGEKIKDVIPDTVMYQSPSFVKGRVVMKDGASGVSTINYNWVLKEMLYINEKKDTVAISDPALFEYFAMAQDTFYYSPKKSSFVKKLGSYGNLMLCESKDLKISNIKKVGALGISPAVHSERITNALSPTAYVDLAVKEELTLSVVPEYYLKSKNGDFVEIMNRKSIKKMLNSKELSAFDNYVKANDVNFSNKHDLLKLFESISQSL